MVVYEPLPKLRQGKDLMLFVKEAQYNKFDPSGVKRKILDKSNPEKLRSGDVVRIVYKEQSPAVGAVIAINKSGLGTTLLLRNMITGVGVEIHVPVFSPMVERIDIVRRPAKYKGRTKHYYIRNTRLDVGDLESSIGVKRKV